MQIVAVVALQAAYVRDYASLYPCCNLAIYKRSPFSSPPPPHLDPVRLSSEFTASRPDALPLTSVLPTAPTCRYPQHIHYSPIMPAKKRCQSGIGSDAQCNSAALRIVGECPHCRAQFCGAVSGISSFSCLVPCLTPVAISAVSTVSQSTITARIWRTADNKPLTAIRTSWRVSGLWLPRWLLRSCLS
jgi:hypothetical protein